ncbi:MAG: twin-arginine translocase TatA/TatE family subunit [Atopobiaceae bacterium]|nr:twin-arginine translocase TatA/TatE family subunit [Atopobiaceae bacterium]MCI2174167.1 twin-arginine translocase TatA/TatE family subunit [Atopobiaceae bacterium]MCI2206808.1 twin-arginine translocase TatA/TatE family subunit [Atopobiaceae bacterium]
MFGIGETEFAIILLFGFLLFGPDKLPGMGRTIGRALRQFREAQDGLTKVVQTEIVDPMNKAADEDAATDDLDADADAPASDKPSKPAESFAQRKARLEAEAAEKTAGEAGDKTADAASEKTTDAAASDDTAASDVAEKAPATTDASEGEDAAAAKAEAAEKRRRSAAALYGLDEPATSDAPDASCSPDTSDTGKGDEGEQA